jgi:transposase
MESIGPYWKPVFNILEDSFKVILANARHIKNVPGRKTDVKDSEWICKLLRSGLLTASFVPLQAIRDLRDLDTLPAEINTSCFCREEPYTKGTGGCEC